RRLPYEHRRGPALTKEPAASKKVDAATEARSTSGFWESSPVQWIDAQTLTLRRFFEHVGRVTILGGRTLKTLVSSRFDFKAFVYQLEQLGIKSLMIAAATAIFVGIVMTIQFAFFAEKYGAKDSLPRIIG